MPRTTLLSARRHISSLDPFGNIVSKSGPLAEANVYRFASQEYHQNSGLVVYLRRAYEPILQRWLNRDPLNEKGGFNLFEFVANRPVDAVDPLGLDLMGRLDDGLNGVGFFGGAFNWFTEGRDVHVPFRIYDPLWAPTDFDGFDDFVRSVCARCPGGKKVPLEKTRDLYAEGPVTIGLKGGPGRISVRLDGFIMSYNDTCPCNWKFKGKVSIPRDRFNFDNPLDDGRTGPGMVITSAVWLFASIAETVGPSQNESDATNTSSMR